MNWKKRTVGIQKKPMVQNLFAKAEKYILHQGQELNFWRAYARELEGTFDGMENKLIAMENANSIENRLN
ncbi:hypothetical protein SAMN05421823_10640 [Catalinimonas alkaloidigena]|uniref:Uncharacterized protein n=1 Tax=Catalinimonas alkaloidigena TaxID=1075417 RepID=A0A1G9K3R3_9BACT|nr:hypothetical protein [Catalinimonas alkaloidigena]SDL44368.1 hypothetical protein SAMN05421823_10640 [Catalinimonas alkaloidigena]